MTFRQRDCFVFSVNTGDGNHVHMLVSIPPDMTISATVSRIKQLTTHELWNKHPAHLRRYYWESTTSYGLLDTIAKLWEGTAKA